MIYPRIFVDFHNADSQGRLRLNCVGANDDFDLEIVQTRRNEKLMAFLDDRAKQAQTISIDEVRRQLGII